MGGGWARGRPPRWALLPAVVVLVLGRLAAGKEGCGLCNQRLVLNFTTDEFPAESSWTLSAGTRRSDCDVDVAAAGTGGGEGKGGLAREEGIG